METSETNDPAISGLMSMVDYFLSHHPQQVQEGVHCLLTALSLHPPPRIEARARLQLGLVLYHHTNNLLEAREHLDKAMLVAQSAANLEDVRFEAASVAARILLEQNCIHQAKSLLRGKLEGSSRFPYWHVRLMLQLADVYACERDESSVVSTLDRCVEYTRHTEAPYTRLLCLLYKGAYQLTHKRYHEAGEVLNLCSTLLEEYQGERATLLRTFYLVIQVTHLLSAGQVKTAKPHLKQLQQCVKILSTEQNSSNPPTSNTLTAESFEWLTREQAYVIVYLVSMMHSVQAGYTEKALSYADKAMQFIDQQKDTGVVSVLKAYLLENIILCLLVQGNSSQAIDKLHETVGICHAHPQLVYSHRAVLHTLLGLYAFATDGLDRAVSQFHTALQHTNSGDLRVFVSLNLAVAYMKLGEERSTELSALMQSLENPSTSCQSLLAAVHYVKGLHSFCQLKLHEAKRHLRETLVTSNSGDLNKLTTCSLILLGQIFLSLGNTKETMDMVNPAMQLASKIPDKKLQVWAATLLADLYHLSGDQASELSTREKCSKALEELRSDQTCALKSSHHSLIQWTVGEWPVVKPISKPTREDPMLTSPSANVVVKGDSLPGAIMSPRKSEVPLLDGLKLKRASVQLENIATTPERVRNREVPQSARTLNYDGTHTHRSEEAERMELGHVKGAERANRVVHKRPSEHNLQSQSPLQKQQHLPTSNHRTPTRKRDHHETSTSIRKNAPASLSLRNSSSSSPGWKENPNGANSASPTLRGSPVALKTPEIRLTKVNGNSPFASSPRQLQFPPQLTTQQHTQSLVPKLTTQQHTQSPVPKLTTQQHTQSPVPKLTTEQHTHSPVPNAPDLQHTSPPQPQPQLIVPTQMQSSPIIAATGGSPYQNMASLSSPQTIINPTVSPTPQHQTIVHSPNPNPHSPVPSGNHMQVQRSSTSPHQQTKHSPRSPIVQSRSPQMLYHHQQEALLMRHQQQQQQLQQQAHALSQQQNVLQHYNPQTLQHMHSLSPSISEQQQQLQQQQLQQQRLFQQQQQAFQQQMMLQQAQAQQQYFLQQASMRNHQQAMLTHSPVHLQAGMTQYAVNPSAMPPALHHSFGSPSKQVHGQPHLGHMNVLQRLSQEPSRSSLCAMALPQGHSMAPVMNSYGSPYHGQSIQLLPNGSNMQGVNPNPSASPLRHYSPQGHMPG